MAPGSAEPVTRARRAVLTDHADVVAATLDCADRAAENRPGPITDGQSLATAFERELGDAGLRSRYPTVLADAVVAAGLELSASPVSAPPYVVVTSRGPVLRGTTDAGRLVVTLEAFAVRSTDPVRYVRSATDPRAAVDVALR